MRSASLLTAGVTLLLVTACSGGPALAPFPAAGQVGVLARSTAPATKTFANHFSVSDAVLDYTADAVAKSATTLRSAWGRNPQALKDCQLVVSVHQVVGDRDKTVRNYEVSADFSSYLQGNPGKSGALSILKKATVSFPYPMNMQQGSFAAIPTGEAAGSQLTYYVKVTANGPMASRGQRERLAENFVSDYGKNFKATVKAD